MNDPRRSFRYILAFAGLLTALYAVTGLLGLAISLTALRDNVLSSTDDNRVRASLYLAELIVGLPVWLALWIASQRRVESSDEERDSAARRVFLGTTFAFTSVVALFALHSVLRYVFTLPGTSDIDPTAQNAVFSVARLFVFGAAWLYHARIGWTERGPQEDDEAHDVAVSVLAGFSLMFLAIGAVQALGESLGNLISSGQPVFSGVLPRSIWDRWGAIAAWILSGGFVWAAIWQYELSRGGARRVRVAYLWIVLLFAAPTALWSAATMLYELLRRGLGYDPRAESTWQFLVSVLPILLVSGVVWAHHWAVVRDQPSPRSEGERHMPGAILWPRRLPVAVLVALGLSMVTVAIVAVLWLSLDFVLNTGNSLSGGAWWRDRLSGSIGAGLVGLPAWLGGWNLLQRAAASAPQRERGASERRRLLGFIVLSGLLAAIGFGISLLWLVLQALLGAGLDGGEVSRMLKSLSAILVALSMVAYHGQTLRRDLAFGPALGTSVRISAFVAPGSEVLLAQLRESTGHRIKVVGFLSDVPRDARHDRTELEKQLASLSAPGSFRAERALILLGPNGGSIHAYSHQRPVQATDMGAD